MVGWLYIDDSVAAPIRVLETDRLTGVMTLEVGAKFVSSRSMLRGKTVVEYRGWDRRRAIRCLGAEEIGPVLMIEAIDVGHAGLPIAVADPDSGDAEDWLIVDGHAQCMLSELSIGEKHEALLAHCQFRVGLDAWRDLRIGQGAPLASVGIVPSHGDSNDGSITPLLHAARQLGPGEEPPRVEIVRLRERMRYLIDPMATDWGESTTLVIARILEASPLNAGRSVTAEQASA